MKKKRFLYGHLIPVNNLVFVYIYIVGFLVWNTSMWPAHFLHEWLIRFKCKKTFLYELTTQFVFVWITHMNN